MNLEISGIVRRRLLDIVDELTNSEPVLTVLGPRTVGKSTLLKTFADARGVAVIDLDDPGIRDAANANPSQFVLGATPLCFDEYQRAPDLLPALKARLNREGAAPGTAVLTGSTRQDAQATIADSLTGRAHGLSLLPLSRGEITGRHENFLSAFIADPVAVVEASPTSSTTRADYVSYVCAGGFPLALRRTGAARSRWFDDYVRQTVERDAIELGRIRQRDVLRLVLNRLAGQTGQLLNATRIADGLAADRKTVDSYIRLLEDLFLVQRLPAWGTTLRSKAAKLPKVHVVDSGVGAWLLGLTESKLSALSPSALTEFGHLFETFVVGELRKQVSWLDESVTLGHWRSTSSDEVDLVIELHDGRTIAFAVKANERASGRDLDGLRKLREALGEQFVGGAVLGTGVRSYTAEDRLHVLPVDRLWQAVPT